MAKAGAGEASALSPNSISISIALNAIAPAFASDVSAHGGGIAEESTLETGTTTENALVITAIVVVVFHHAAMLCRTIVLPRRESHLCACRGIRACLRIVPQRVQRVLRR